VLFVRSTARLVVFLQGEVEAISMMPPKGKTNEKGESIEEGMLEYAATPLSPSLPPSLSIIVVVSLSSLMLWERVVRRCERSLQSHLTMRPLPCSHGPT
jgi:hypothetical protein